MRFTPFATLAAIAVGTMTVGTMATAQTMPPPGGQPDRGARWQAHDAAFKAHFEAMRKQRADDIALLIGLRADQRPAFDAMLATMEPPHRGPGGRGPGEGGPDGKPPKGQGGPDESMTERLDHMSARIDERSAAAKARLTALKTFYAGLSPDQRLRFDALDRLRHEHGGMGPHGEHGHDGPGAPPPPAG